MPAPNLEVDWRRFQQQAGSLESLLPSLHSLPVSHRKLVAEMIMIRLVMLVGNTMSSACLKILCGTQYLDGASPLTIETATSMANARNLVRCYGRQQSRSRISWLSSADIRENLRYVILPCDPIYTAIDNHAHMLTEARQIRNHIAHRNDSTSRKFRSIVRAHYGGLKRGVSPGVFLLTDAFGIPVLLEKYIRYLRVFIREVVRAF